uniref:MHC class I-like antigen recognition-like domain-containing protein n=1 Tax=Urocitellus parryii TaxID=9999 RepID=A0A8D2GK30_UROPR
CVCVCVCVCVLMVVSPAHTWKEQVPSWPHSAFPYSSPLISTFHNHSWVHVGSGWLGELQTHSWNSSSGTFIFLYPWSRGNFSNRELVDLERFFRVHIIEVQEFFMDHLMSECEFRYRVTFPEGGSIYPCSLMWSSEPLSVC